MVPNISIIILNWNGWSDTIECLESIYQIDYPNYNVIVIDNFSQDNSVKKIKEYCKGKIEVISDFFVYNDKNKPLKIYEIEENSFLNKKNNFNVSNNFDGNNIILIRADENHGFAKGNNLGISFALENFNPDFFLLLNNDTVVDSSFLSELLKGFENDDTGIVGSKIYFYNNEKLIQSAGFNINWFSGETVSFGYKKNDYFHEKILDAVSGCSMLIKRDVINQIGLLNSKYFLYYEDTDFCVRAQKAGFNITCSQESKVWHKDSISSRKISGTREFYSARNLFWFMKQHSSRTQFLVFIFYFMSFKFWIKIVIIVFYHKEISALTPFIKGVYNGIRDTLS